MLFLVMFFNGKWEESLMSSHSPCYLEIKGLFKSREIYRKQVKAYFRPFSTARE